MAVSSMTGYAVASAPTGLGTVTVECRSVNSRFLDLTLRLAEDLRFAEPLIREILQKSLARGKVEIFFNARRKRRASYYQPCTSCSFSRNAAHCA